MTRHYYTTTHALVGSGKLQHLSNRAEVAALVVSQTLDDANVNYVKRIRSDNGRVDVTVIDKVTHNLHTHRHIDTDRLKCSDGR